MTRNRAKRQAFAFYQREITKTGSIEDMEKLRTEIRGDQEELGIGRRIRLEQNCDRRANILGRQGKVYAEAA